MDKPQPPAQEKAYDLAKLLESITPENLHEEVDSGPPRGNETPSAQLD